MGISATSLTLMFSRVSYVLLGLTLPVCWGLGQLRPQVQQDPESCSICTAQCISTSPRLFSPISHRVQVNLQGLDRTPQLCVPSAAPISVVSEV